MKDWVLNWRGQRYTSDELTAGQMVAACHILGENSWDAINAWKSPKHLVAVLAAVTGDLDAIMAASAVEVVSAISAKE